MLGTSKPFVEAGGASITGNLVMVIYSRLLRLIYVGFVSDFTYCFIVNCFADIKDTCICYNQEFNTIITPAPAPILSGLPLVMLNGKPLYRYLCQLSSLLRFWVCRRRRAFVSKLTFRLVD